MYTSKYEFNLHQYIISNSSLFITEIWPSLVSILNFNINLPNLLRSSLKLIQIPTKDEAKAKLTSNLMMLFIRLDKLIISCKTCCMLEIFHNLEPWLYNSQTSPTEWNFGFMESHSRGLQLTVKFFRINPKVVFRWIWERQIVIHVTTAHTTKILNTYSLHPLY